ncbi:DUF6123 family protein [Aureibacillus halotolerans]|uniref:Uncharacterized protein n=1 Tax=Aureibacillus halotolerans TaxID=1508390 RepID=A0A4R6U4R6_9BACI|nr:DUF6123 family protein [Aureibacillus halotolerans]TDQ41470.1 hypothetical protein EV213_10347 [Aureibacillus halotolerans]
MSALDLGTYIDQLNGRGFRFTHSDIMFIHFAQKYTDANDAVMIYALELVLSLKFSFDSSFYIALVEQLLENKVSSKKDAIALAKKLGLYDRLLT